jgi:tetratricopeptide (TPR) repeat protein
VRKEPLGAAEKGQVDALYDRLARVAVTARQLNDTAWHLAQRGRADEGLPLAEKSIRLDPLCWRCQDTYAVLLAEKGRLDEALAASDRALALLPEKASAEALLQHRRRIEEKRRAPSPR